MKLSEFAGNRYIIKSIREAVTSGRIAGAYLFDGALGSGKSEIAKIFADAIICQNAEYKQKYGDACGVCSACAKSLRNIHPDVIVAKSEEDRAGAFSIEKVREIIDDLYLTPNEGDRKVYILEDMQNMGIQAQNALLKSIEEPPPFVVFIITVANRELILDTVASRAVKFSMEYIDRDEMGRFLRKCFSGMDLGITEEDIKKAVRLSSGAIGVAMKILREKTAIYDEIFPQIKNMLSVKANNSKAKILESFQQLTTKIISRNELLGFYSALELAARDILTTKLLIDSGDEGKFGCLEYFESVEEIEEIANIYSTEKILELLQKIHDFKSDLDYNINTRINIAGFFASSG